jgi:hypothetical protein
MKDQVHIRNAEAANLARAGAADWQDHQRRRA